MTNLTGTEKQIKWAEDIRTKFMENVGNATEDDCKKTTDYPEDFDYEIFQKLVKIILNQESAKWWIEQIEKTTLEDIAMIAEDPDEDDMEDFLNAYKIKA